MANNKVQLSDGTILVDLTADTVTEADVLNSKKFHKADGSIATGSAVLPTPTLISKTVSANGTYNASTDHADGYSSVTVSIPVYDGSVS